MSTSPPGDSLIANLPRCAALSGTEVLPIDQVISGSLQTVQVSMLQLAQQLSQIQPIPSAQLTFIQTGTGAVTRTVQDKFQDGVSVLDFMTDAQKTDVKAGTIVYDVVGAFTNAIATGRPVYVPNGPGWKYKFGSALSIPSNSNLISNGANIVLANSTSSHVIRISDFVNRLDCN